MNRKRRTAARNCSNLMQLNLFADDSDKDVSYNSSSSQYSQTEEIMEKKATIGTVIMAREFPLVLREEADFNQVIKAIRQEFIIGESLIADKQTLSLYPLIEY